MILTEERVRAIDKVLDLAKKKQPIHFDLFVETGLGTRGLGKLLKHLEKQGYREGNGRRYLEIPNAHS
jgi:hypothetical protein